MTADAQNIKDYFKSSPASLFQNIDSVSRNIMFDKTDAVPYYSGVKTIFGDSVMVNKVTDNFIAFKSSNLDVQMMLSDDVIIVCSTYADKNSEVSFYDTDWQLKSSWMYGTIHSKKMPSDEKIFDALVVKPEDMSEERFERLKLYFDPMLVRAELYDEGNVIKLTPFAPMLSDEEKTELKPVIKQKTFKWINGKYK